MHQVQLTVLRQQQLRHGLKSFALTKIGLHLHFDVVKLSEHMHGWKLVLGAFLGSFAAKITKNLDSFVVELLKLLFIVALSREIFKFEHGDFVGLFELPQLNCF
jgi:hypothetical protein